MPPINPILDSPGVKNWVITIMMTPIPMSRPAKTLNFEDLLQLLKRGVDITFPPWPLYRPLLLD